LACLATCSKKSLNDALAAGVFRAALPPLGLPRQLQQQVQTQLNTLQTYENTVLQVARMGNPAALRNLPGVSNVADLSQIYGQLTVDHQRIQALTNPATYQADVNAILSRYSQGPWNGFTAANGVKVLPNPSEKG
jgi:hypothetical protein